MPENKEISQQYFKWDEGTCGNENKGDTILMSLLRTTKAAKLLL